MSMGSPGSHSDSPPHSSLAAWLRRFAALWGFVLFILFLLVVFRSVILPFVLGMLVAYVLAPVVRKLSSLEIGGRRLPRSAAIISVYIAIAAALALFLTAFLPRLSSDFARLFREAPRFFNDVEKSYLPRADAWLERTFPQRGSDEPKEPRHERKLTLMQRSPGIFEISLEDLQLEIEPTGKGRYVVGPRSDEVTRPTRVSDLLAQAAHSTESEVKGILSVGRRFLVSVIKTFAWFILTFMVAAYLLADLERVFAFLRSLVPEQHRSAFDELVVLVDHSLAGLVRGQLIICVVNGILTTVGLFIFHVKYALLLGMVAGMMSFIPVFGSILSSIPIVIVGLASGTAGASLTTGVEILCWIIAIHFLEANVLNPKIIGTAAKIHPVVVVFALLVGEETGGLAGALLAVPCASIVQAIFLYLHRRQSTYAKYPPQ
jgi:predicted PurR-regulated permease PerM